MMDWLRSFIVVLTLSSLAWSYKFSESPDCNLYTERNGQIEFHCMSNNVGFGVLIQPASKSVTITCHGNLNWTYFHSLMEEPIKAEPHLTFNHCNPPETGIAAVMGEFQFDEVMYLDFQSLKNGTSLTKETLRGFNNLRNLELIFSDLSNLGEDVLGDLKNLTWVRISMSNLDKVPKNFFVNWNLHTIDLGSNHLETFEVQTFDRLPNLLKLIIERNKLRNLLPHTFDGLTSLELLSIHDNFLESLPKQIFKKMRKLRKLYLGRNNFTEETLPGDLLQDNIKLKFMWMSDNKRNITSLPNGFFANLTELETVWLPNNGFISLPDDLFRGTSNLIHVALMGNFLKTLPSKIFKDTTKILELNLSINNISDLPDDVFRELRELQFLNLSGNRLTSINEKLFAGLKSLMWLSMNSNGLKTIDTWAFKATPKLRTIDLWSNELTLQPTSRSLSSSILSPFHTCNELEFIHLSHNNVSNIFEDWKTSLNLKFVDLSHNQLQELKDTDLKFSSQNLTVNLEYNNLTYIDLTTVETWAVKRNPAHSVTISIKNNPIRCDCQLYDFLRYLDGRLHRNVRNTLKLLIGESKCHGPRDFLEIPITHLRSKTLTCNVNEQDFGVQCPDKCNCHMHPESNGFIVDCGYKGLIEAPRKLDCLLNHRIDRIEMNLTGNYLTKMPDLGQNGYNRVTMLRLDHNNISSVTVNGLSNELEGLYLNNNNITRLSSAVINFLKNATKLRNLTLEANPWLCDCDTRDFRHFIKAKHVSNLELLKIKCNGCNTLIFDMTPEKLCPSENTWIIVSCSMIAIAGIIIGTLAAVYYRYQQAIKIWLFAHHYCLSCVTEDELDRDKRFDAFVSYSHKDEDFVENNILPRLEAGPRPYELCIHTRDWIPGEWITVQIASSIEKSRRTIIILSQNYIESNWGITEFRTAHQQTLNEGRARVIIVIYGEIGPIENLDPELKCYLAMNTYIKWGDPWFWEKLEYALSHPATFIRGTE